MTAAGPGVVARKISDSRDYEGMDKPLASVSLDASREVLTFRFKDGSEARFRAEGECCSSSWIEHLEAPESLDGAVLDTVEDEQLSRTDDPVHDCLRVYQTKFRTTKGETITVEYRNSSNGYYGGYLARMLEGEA